MIKDEFRAALRELYGDGQLVITYCRKWAAEIGMTVSGVEKQWYGQRGVGSMEERILSQLIKEKKDAPVSP